MLTLTLKADITVEVQQRFSDEVTKIYNFLCE